MVQSPVEEDGNNSGMSSDSWPRRRRYATGDEVEVLFSGQGFRGARYEATVTARLPDSDRYKVVYSELIKCCGGPPLQESAYLLHSSDIKLFWRAIAPLF